MTITETSAILAATLLAALSLFQVSLIFGAPLGKMAWGGAHTILPTRLKIASASSLILYVFFALVVLQDAGVFTAFGRVGWIGVAMWILTGYFFLGIIMNVISRSRDERLVMTPVAGALAILFLIVALR